VSAPLHTAVVPFDFRAAPRIAASVATQLHGLQSRFAPSLQGLLTARFRQPCDVEPMTAVSWTAHQYSTSCVAPEVRFRCDLHAHAPQSAVLMMSPDLAHYAIARLFGGAQQPAGESRPLTAIEHAVLADLIGRVLPRLADAGRPELDLTGAVGNVISEEPPEIASVGDALVRLAFTLRCGNASGAMAFVFPARVLGGAVPAGTAEPSRPVMEAHLAAMTIPLSVRIHLRVPAFEIAALREGQVLETGHPSHGDVEVASNGRPLFAGVLGRHQGHVGVRILRPLTPDANSTPNTRRITDR
jgi:flagellar motor switch protein FliM